MAWDGERDYDRLADAADRSRKARREGTIADQQLTIPDHDFQEWEDSLGHDHDYERIVVDPAGAHD